MRTTLLLFASLASLAPIIMACPGSPSSVHANCEMTVTFPSDSCLVVRHEMLARLYGQHGWKDPHNQGSYTLLEYDSDKGDIRGSRKTGDGKYTDLFDFTFTASEKDGCVVQACSESQVFSILDFSTNYCNLFALYCNTTDGCPIVHHDLTYTEDYTSCWQRAKQNCVSSLSDNL